MTTAATASLIIPLPLATVWSAVRDFTWPALYAGTVADCHMLDKTSGSRTCFCFVCGVAVLVVVWCLGACCVCMSCLLCLCLLFVFCVDVRLIMSWQRLELLVSSSGRVGRRKCSVCWSSATSESPSWCFHHVLSFHLRYYRLAFETVSTNHPAESSAGGYAFDLLPCFHFSPFPEIFTIRLRRVAETNSTYISYEAEYAAGNAVFLPLFFCAFSLALRRRPPRPDYLHEQGAFGDFAGSDFAYLRLFCLILSFFFFFYCRSCAPGSWPESLRKPSIGCGRQHRH
jgi:hypothetical protein